MKTSVNRPDEIISHCRYAYFVYKLLRNIKQPFITSESKKNYKINNYSTIST